MRLTLFKILLCLISVPVFADDVLDLRQWSDLSIIAQQHMRESIQSQSLLPAQIQAANSPNGVLQQVFMYNLDQLRAAHPEAQAVEKWGAGLTSSSKSSSSSSSGPSSAPAEPKWYSFDFKPTNSKAIFDIRNTLRATLTLQPWSHQTELRVTPHGTLWNGAKVEFSHVSSPGDEEDRILLTLAW